MTDLQKLLRFTNIVAKAAEELKMTPADLTYVLAEMTATVLTRYNLDVDGYLKIVREFVTDRRRVINANQG